MATSTTIPAANLAGVHVTGRFQLALLTLGVMTTYYAGAAKLGAALARDGDLPARLALGSEPGEVPLRGLLLTASLALVAFVVADLTGVRAAPLVLSGPYLLCPVAVAAAALGYGWRASTARRAAPRP